MKVCLYYSSEGRTICNPPCELCKNVRLVSKDGEPIRTDEHTNSCPRAAKLERRIIDHYYNKSEIDERVKGILELQEWLAISHKSMEFTEKLQALRERFL